MDIINPDHETSVVNNDNGNNCDDRAVAAACNQPRQYGYYERSFGVELLLSAFFAPILFALVGLAGYYYYHVGALSVPIARSAVYIAIVYVFTRIFYRNARHAAKTKSVIVSSDAVIKKNADAASVLNFSETRGVKISRGPLAKKLILQSEKGCLAISLCMRGGSDLVKRIFDGLFANSAIPHDTLAAAQSASAAAAFFESAKRKLRMKRSRALFWSASAAALLGGVTATLFWESSPLHAVGWIFINMYLQVLAYFTAERRHIKKITRRSLENTRDVDDNYPQTALAALFVGMVAGIIFNNPQ